MSVPVVAFFNNKGGVGKTTLVYHLAWMFSELGTSTLAVDLDPQANLSAAFINEDYLEEAWTDMNIPPRSIYRALQPLIEGSGDVAQAQCFRMNDKLHLIAGDLRLSEFEDSLAETWPKCLSRDLRALRITSAIWRISQQAALTIGAKLILFDLGPNLGAINRSALISSDWVVIPLAPDMYSLQGLRNLGPKLKGWRLDWKQRLDANPDVPFQLPHGRIAPAGYIVLQHKERLNRPVKSYLKWMRRIPEGYHAHVLDDVLYKGEDVLSDPQHLALVKHYQSLMPMAQEARKPIFHLKPSDGAIGSHAQSVSAAYGAFQTLAGTILSRIGII